MVRERLVPLIVSTLIVGGGRFRPLLPTPAVGWRSEKCSLPSAGRRTSRNTRRRKAECGPVRPRSTRGKKPTGDWHRSEGGWRPWLGGEFVDEPVSRFFQDDSPGTHDGERSGRYDKKHPDRLFA